MIRCVTYVLAIAAASPLAALTLEDCARTTHPSHAGEAQHHDYGGGNVGYVEWWSQEGVYTDVVIASCESGTFLRTRLREERISDRPPFDRTKAGKAVIETEMRVAPALFSFERLAASLDRVGKDIEIATLSEEPCACAAAYPELRGQKEPFVRDK